MWACGKRWRKAVNTGRLWMMSPRALGLSRAIRSAVQANRGGRLRPGMRGILGWHDSAIHGSASFAHPAFWSNLVSRAAYGGLSLFRLSRRLVTIGGQ